MISGRPISICSRPNLDLQQAGLDFRQAGLDLQQAGKIYTGGRKNVRPFFSVKIFKIGLVQL